MEGKGAVVEDVAEVVLSPRVLPALEYSVHFRDCEVFDMLM